MKKIASFTINHDTLMPGVYVSRIDGDITTYDMRFVRPNTPPFLPNPVMHTIEHLFATYARNSEYADNVIYFGPMGCRTGCYLLMFGDLKSEDVYDIIIRMCDFILSFEGEIPGAKPEECGNYSEQNLNMAKYYIRKYKTALMDNKSFEYKYL